MNVQTGEELGEGAVLPVQENNFSRHNLRTFETEYPISHQMFLLTNLTCSRVATQIIEQTQKIVSKAISP